MAEEVKTQETAAQTAEQKQPEIYKAFSVNFYDNGTVEVKSEGKQELTTDEIYDHIIILKDKISRKRIVDEIGETVYGAAYQGTRRFYSDAAEEKMRRENAAAAEAPKAE